MRLHPVTTETEQARHAPPTQLHYMSKLIPTNILVCHISTYMQCDVTVAHAAPIQISFIVEAALRPNPSDWYSFEPEQYRNRLAITGIQEEISLDDNADDDDLYHIYKAYAVEDTDTENDVIAYYCKLIDEKADEDKSSTEPLDNHDEAEGPNTFINNMRADYTDEVVVRPNLTDCADVERELSDDSPGARRKPVNNDDIFNKRAKVNEEETVSVGTTNTDTVTTLAKDTTTDEYVIFTVHNFQRDTLKHFMEGIHCTQLVDIHCPTSNRSKIVGIHEISTELIQQDVQSYRRIRLTKVQIDEDKFQRFKKQDLAKKRSISSCGNIIRGLAIAEYDRKLLKTVKNKRIRNNKFTNVQRMDRGAGNILSKRFESEHRVSACDELTMIEQRCNVKLTIFEHEGFVKFYSGSDDKTALPVQFYETHEEYYLIRNLRGFTYTY